VSNFTRRESGKDEYYVYDGRSVVVEEIDGTIAGAEIPLTYWYCHVAREMT